MTILLTLIGWVIVSAVCTPLIGRFLYSADSSRISQPAGLRQRAFLPFVAARRERMRRRSTANQWPRRVVGQPKAG